MFNSFTLTPSEQLKERIRNLITIKKNSFIYNLELGFDWMNYFNNPLDIVSLEQDLTQHLESDPDINSAKVVSIEEGDAGDDDAGNNAGGRGLKLTLEINGERVDLNL